MTPQGKIIVLVEREEHLTEAARLVDQDPRYIVLVALSPAVIRAMDKKGIPYVTPELYISSRELNECGQKNYDLLENLLQWVDARMTHWPEHLRLNPIVYDFYRLKLLVDSFSLRVRELLAIIDKEKPVRLVVCSTAQDPLWASFESDSFVAHDAPIYAAIAPTVAKGLQLECDIRMIRPAKTSSSWTNISASLYDGLRPMKMAIKSLFSVMRHKGNRPVAWQFSVQSHDVPFLIKLFSNSFDFVLWDNLWTSSLLRRFLIRKSKTVRQDEQRILEQWWKNNAESLSQQPIFQVSAINIFPLVEHALRFRFIQGHRQACDIFQAARQLIQTYRPALAVGISSPFYQVTVFAYALQSEHIPLLFAQEGGLYGYCHSPMYHYCELSAANYLLSYGQGVTEKLESLQLSSRQHARVLPVGSRRLRQSVSRPLLVNGRKTRVMYVPTSDFHHCLRYAPVHYSDRSYFKLKERILQALLERSDVDVIYKCMPHMWERDSVSDIIKEHPDRITVNQDPLMNVLDLPDVFVLDWPNTSLLEVLCTRRPVIALIDSEALEVFDGVLPLLRRRARVFVSKDEFMNELREGSLCDTKENVDDTAFIDAFATGGDEAWSDDKIRDFAVSTSMATSPS